MSNGGQPLPAPPGHQRPTTHGRERSKSTFSLRSGNSHKSNGSAGKISNNETHHEKESKRLHSKADPTMAMNEEQPFSMAGSTGTNISNLRALTHKDAHGNPIADPDLSNPTRSRWERPLDTIRAFEAAIDGNYKRQSYARTDVESIAPGGKRGSYYAGSNMGAQTPGRPPQDNYLGGRQSVYSQHPDYRGNGNGMRQDGYPEQPSGPSNGYTPNRARYPRSASDQPNGQGPYTNAYGNQPSYETVTTASGSGSEPLGYSTDPSSENSSIDRYPAASRGDPNGGEYGSYNNGIPHTNGVQFSPAAGYGPPDGGHGNRGPPAPVHKETAQAPPPRVPIKLGGSSTPGSHPTVYEPPKPEPTKRKSSFFKRFSKN